MKTKIYIMAVTVLMAVFPPLSQSAMEYKHKLELENMTFEWRVEADHIHVRLLADTTGWVGIGFDPEKAMSGANIIIGAVKKGRFKVEDHYASRKRGHTSDEKLGGTNDVLNPIGTEEKGVTTIAFSMLLDTGDKYDKPIKPEGTTKVMLAYGAGRDSFRDRHPFRTVYEINLSTGENKKIK